MVFHPSLPLAGTFSLHRAVAGPLAGRSAALFGAGTGGGVAGRRRREPRGAGARTFAGGEVVSTDKAPAAVGPYSQVRLTCCPATYHCNDAAVALGSAVRD